MPIKAPCIYLSRYTALNNEECPSKFHYPEVTQIVANKLEG